MKRKSILEKNLDQRSKKEKSIFDNGADLSSMYKDAEIMQPFKLFYLINKTMPSAIGYENTDWYIASAKIIKSFDINKCDIFSVKDFNLEKKKYFTAFSVIAIKKNLFLVCDCSSSNVNIYILYNSEISPALLNKVERIILSSELKNDYSGNLFLLQSDQFGNTNLVKYPIKSEIDGIESYYNDDFQKVHNTIISRLGQENDKGLVLLHGLPGTGKTSYLKYLATKLKKRIIFIPPDLMSMIASPQFLSVFNMYANSIIIIEDAENIIEQRKGGTNSAVSNLLNITDGLLSECLKVQIICTFNTDISKIDTALLRKGRLIARYEFKALAKQKAQNLSNKLGFNHIIENDMILTEIANQEKNYHNDDEKKSIGFNIGK